MKAALKYFIPFILLLAACGPAKVVDKKAAFYPLKNDTLGIDSTVYKMILPYKAKVDAAMSEVIAVSDTALAAPDRKTPPAESLLGNFLSDLFLKTGRAYYKPTDGKNIDFVLMNTGGIRTSLPKGNITRGNIFEVLPFDNRLTVVTITGDSLQSLLNYIAKKGGDPVAGLQLAIKDKKPATQSIAGRTISKTETYKVLTNDFCAIGGDNMWFFTGAVKYEDLGVILRDAVIAELTRLNSEGKHITSSLDGRITHAE